VTRARLAVLADYLEEGWPSMDLVADMLLRNLPAVADDFEATAIRPSFRRRFSRVPVLGRRRAAFNADRFVNRFWDYPRLMRRRVTDFDLFHLCDHSYSQLVHVLPAERTGVLCHDLDTFACLLEPKRERRPRWFRAMARRVLRGLQKAAVVFHTTGAVREALLGHSLVDEARLVQAPYGIAPAFRMDAPAPPPGSLPELPESFLLHVGSCIPRKRMDVLLSVFAAVRERFPLLRLVKVGDAWTDTQKQQIHDLGIESAIVQLPRLGQDAIAHLYRRANLVLLPSESEGFGLPLIEAMACGGVVVASDVPVLREVGGEAGVYCPLADVPAWTETVCRLLSEPGSAPALEVRLERAGRYRWDEQARTIASAYRRLLSEASGGRQPPESGRANDVSVTHSGG
jgi:glycosyltransferase involved in cell wall biosynthesis